MSGFDIDEVNEWIGKQQEVGATVLVDTANLMNATLSRDPDFVAGDALPPAWHWLYFHEAVRGDALGVEGHAELGGFMPPISFAVDASGDPVPPRRMWAGGSIEFVRPIPLGSQATKVSTVRSITPKEGRSGKLCFVVVAHEIRVEGETCLREEQTIVYREAVSGEGGTVQAKPAPQNADFSSQYTPTPAMLFRYSALTFNAHRIHYDVDFCRQHEGYPDLVVHGPLTATLLLDLFQRNHPQAQITHFTYRGLSPLFHPHPFTANGMAAGDLWAANHEDGLAMSATVQVA